MSEEEPCGRACDGCLEVLGEPATSTEPGKGALDDPSPGQELEAFDAGRALDDLDGPRTAVFDGGAQLRAAVDAVGEDVVQPRTAPAQGAQQRDGAVRVLDAGLMNLADKQEALGIGDDVALAPLDAFAGVDATRAATFRGRRALAVDDAGARRRIAPQCPAGARHQSIADPAPGAIVAPAVEVSLHRRARREVLGQGTPLATGGQDIKNSLDDGPQAALARPAQPARRRQQRLQHRPFSIRRATCIPQSVPSILLTSDFSPSHVTLRRSSQPRLNHK